MEEKIKTTEHYWREVKKNYKPLLEMRGGKGKNYRELLERSVGGENLQNISGDEWRRR